MAGARVTSLLLTAALILGVAASAAPGDPIPKRKRCGAGKESAKREAKRRCGKRTRPSEAPDVPPALGPEPAIGGAPVQLRTDPPLYPSFDWNVSDYATRCTGTAPVRVWVAAQDGSFASVDGSTPADGSYSLYVPLEAGQEFTVHATTPGDEKTFHVRCLPADFPDWSFDRFAPAHNEFYAVTPGSGGSRARYVILFDGSGAPIWWLAPSVGPIDAKVLGDGTLAWARRDLSGYEIRDLGGDLLRTVSIVGGSTDLHDLQELSNGDLLLLSYLPRDHVDLSDYGGPPDATVEDAVIQEIDPGGDVVWEWNSKDHIGLEETGRWWDRVLASGEPHDIVHINAVEPDGESLIISTRHTDAIYGIDRATGDVTWKLGGTTTSHSLQVTDDPYGSYPFGGQHDPRRQGDGTVTLYDNGTGLTDGSYHPPRAVRYAIDEDTGTARLVESVSDPEVTASGCCGSARRSSSGSWLMSWGANPLVTEFDASHKPVFRFGFPGGSTYRAFPVPNGLLGRTALRSGMNTMFPRP